MCIKFICKITSFRKFKWVINFDTKHANLFCQDMSGNITECCIREKVSPHCIDACSFYLDIESVIDKPQCLPDFDKLMKCSAGNVFKQVTLSFYVVIFHLYNSMETNVFRWSGSSSLLLKLGSSSQVLRLVQRRTSVSKL